MQNPPKFLQSMMAAHPIGTITERNEFKKTYLNLQYEFHKHFGKLILACFKNPSSNLLDAITGMGAIFSKEYFQSEKKLEKLMAHAETLCQALSHLEVLKVLGKQAAKDPARRDLFERYLLLAKPRLQAIYEDWSIRT